MDSSPWGWGATLSPSPNPADPHWEEAQGWWKDSTVHINRRELQVAVNCRIMWMTQFPQQQRWRLHSDSTSTVWYLRALRGGRRAPLNKLVLTLWQWIRYHNLVFQVSWIPTQANTKADTLSRLRVPLSEAQLLPHHFHRACRLLQVTPTVDGMSSRANRLCKLWISKRLELGSLSTDLFHTSPSILEGHVLWLHPPLHLIQETLSFVRTHALPCLLAVPLWRGMPWHQWLQLHCQGEVLTPPGSCLFRKLGKDWGSRAVLPPPGWQMAIYRLFVRT